MTNAEMIIDTAPTKERYVSVDWPGRKDYAFLIDQEKYKTTFRSLWRRIFPLNRCVVAEGTHREIADLTEMMNADPTRALDILTEWKKERGYE